MVTKAQEAELVTQVQEATALVQEARRLVATDQRTALIKQLLQIALSDDDADTRELHVAGILSCLESEAGTDRPTNVNPFTAGANPNIVDDNSIEHGGVSGWNR